MQEICCKAYEEFLTFSIIQPVVTLQNYHSLSIRAVYFWSGRSLFHLKWPTGLPHDFHNFSTLTLLLQVQLDRLVHMIQMNRGGARKFFQYVQPHMTPSSIGKIQLILGRISFYAMHCAGRPHCPTCPTLSYFVLLFSFDKKCPTFEPKIAQMSYFVLLLRVCVLLFNDG